MREHTVREMNRLGTEKIPFLFLIDFSTQNGIVKPLSDIAPHNIKYRIGQYSNSPTITDTTPSYTFDKKPMPYQEYEKAFNLVQQKLYRGDAYLVNLTFPTEISTNLTLEDIFHYSRQPYNLWLRKRFVIFSPETFITIRNNQIATHPMKGTIDALLPNAREVLLKNPKEEEEHATVVDLLRNDLSTIATGVQVKRFRYVTPLHTHQGKLLQSSSEITGQLPDDWQNEVGNIIMQMLPAGSVTGAPKNSTLQIIEQAEHEMRGFYTGVGGIFDGQAVESFVSIRYIEQRKDRLFFRSGGGITYQSHCKEEYHEMLNKVYLPF